MSKVLMGLVGDVQVNRADPHEVFNDVRGLLDSAEILFGNLEGAYTDTPRWVPGAIGGGGAPARYLDVYADVGFDVMSLANNHILDVGYDAMLETRDRLRSQGVKTCGVGSSLAEAREPAVLEVNGLRIAFLAYASVFPLGYEARSDAPGLAPMRAYNFWRDPSPYIHIPGKAPLVTTVPDEGDLRNLAEDIRLARERADLVVTSFHWGEYQKPFHLTDHETRTARFCIDHGADMVVGHHHHALRGMEWYRGKPILYGLGHFVFDLVLNWTEEFKKGIAELHSASFYDNPYTTSPKEGWPYLPMHEDTRMTVMAWATATRDGVQDIAVLPCRLTADGLVHPLRPGSPETDEVVSYLEQCNRTQGLKSRLAPGHSIAGHETLRILPG